jgi:spoIIIJ-associated protein
MTELSSGADEAKRGYDDEPADAPVNEDATAADSEDDRATGSEDAGVDDSDAGEGESGESGETSEAGAGAGAAGASGGGVDRLKQLEVEGDIAADYLEELLDIADLDGDLDMDVEGDRAAVSIVGTGLDALIGENGEVLEALQELTRLAVHRETGDRSRLMLDIGGFRAAKRDQLVELAKEAIDEVKQSGAAVKLAPMTPFERKVVHDAVAEAGLTSESEGVEPARCVVIQP